MHNNEKLSLLHPGCCNCCNGTDPGTSGLQLVQTPDLHAPLLDCVPVCTMFTVCKDKIKLRLLASVYYGLSIAHYVLEWRNFLSMFYF